MQELQEVETVEDIRGMKAKKDNSGSLERGVIARGVSKRAKVREALLNPETKASVMEYIFNKDVTVNPLAEFRK